MVFFDENGFTTTTKDDGEKISKHLNVECLGPSRIDGYPIFLFPKTGGIFNFYKIYIECEIITPEDYYFEYIATPYKNNIIIKIKKYNPKLFQVSIREDKLKRILKTN